ncbi:uncharacterized protein LOC108625203 isoform X2 [Ceratina calcarata]|uniref:Uncharacterized protein LOC108625203 isoform X2 n=1 Tax=Ceratina calcarata TaxID=156304 RepID=A0AAJ7IZ50_9HYME|nr:uncharacterized protein LOC108625203 isoform X2 [Ceratina calcarata]
MGNYMDKFFPHKNEINNGNESEKEEIRDSVTDGIMENDCMHTPPIIQRVVPADPRSATSGITRTPIEVIYDTPVFNKRLTAVPKYLQRKPYLETDIDSIMCLTPRKRSPRTLIETKKLQISNLEDKYNESLLKPVADNMIKKELITEIQKERYDILGLDPRSPAVDFDRTPLLKPRSLERLKARSQETLQRQGSYEADQLYPSYSYCEMSSQFDVTEVQALPDLASCVLKSLNLNTIIDKSNELESEGSSQPTRSESLLESEKRESGGREIQTLEADTCVDKDVQKETLEEEKCGDDNIFIKVWRDSLVSDKSQKLETDDVEIVQAKEPQVAEEEVIIFDKNNSAKDKLFVKPAKNDKLKVDVIGKKKRGTEALSEKKIFADKNSNGSTTAARTPLGNRSNAHKQMQMVRNSQQTFRSKGVKPKMLQENTPPHIRSVTKSKAIQWDPNSSVII